MMADKTSKSGTSKNGTTHPGAAANIVPKEEPVDLDERAPDETTSPENCDCPKFSKCPCSRPRLYPYKCIKCYKYWEEDCLEKRKKHYTCAKPLENPLTPAEKPRYPCRYCGLTFSTLHKRFIYWPTYSTSCDFCGVKFAKDNELYDHIRTAHLVEIRHRLPRPTKRDEKANITKNEIDKLLDEARKSSIPCVSKEQDVSGKSSSSPENPPSTSNLASKPNKVSVNMKANSNINSNSKLSAEAGNNVTLSLNKSEIISERPPSTTPEFTYISNPDKRSVEKEFNSTKTKRSKSLIEGRKYVTCSVSKEVTSLGQSSVLPENLPSTSSKITDAATPNGLFMNKKTDLPKENVVLGGQSSTPPENHPSTSSQFFHASNENKRFARNADVCDVNKTLRRKLEQAISSACYDAGYNKLKSRMDELLGTPGRVREDPAPPIESNDPASGINYLNYTIKPKLNFNHYLHIKWLMDFITSLKSTSYPLRDTTSKTVAHLRECVIRELTVPGRLTCLKQNYMRLIEAEKQLSGFLHSHFLSVCNLMM